LRGRAHSGDAYAARLQQFYDLNAGLAYALAVPMALAAPWLVHVAYGGAYAAAGPVLAVHVWSTVFVFLGVARGQFLVNEGHTGFYFLSTTAGLLINVALNLVLIPRHGAWGAAVATLAAQMVAAWGSSFCFAPVRANAWMQTRALLIPVRWLHYVRRA
jgi:O-antigen/teichoic acid export membrane protein